MLGVWMFMLIYLYYFRKRWGWFRNWSTKNWLDFHIVLGVTAPIIIAFHAAFKFRGIAGMAFWIMVAVALSGVVGRYLYAQIPRRLDAAELSWQELQDEQLGLTQLLAAQKMFSPGELVAAFHVPDVEMVKHKSAAGALLWMFLLDLARPFRVAALRRRVLGFGGACCSASAVFCERQRRARKRHPHCAAASGAFKAHDFSCPARTKCFSFGMWCIGRSAMGLSFWHCCISPPPCCWDICRTIEPWITLSRS